MENLNLFGISDVTVVMQDITTKIIKTAYERFGIMALKPYQLLVIQRIMEQEDSYRVRHQIVILPTGTGKSLCFLVPATLCKGITVIVYPLLALMNDQMNRLSKAGIECVCIRGGQSREERRRCFEKLREGTKIVVTTPESLQGNWVLSQLRKFHISLFVIDEAHVISQWGKDFRPAYLGLTSVILRLLPHQILAFTATASKKTISDISTCLFTSRPLVVKGDADRPNIIYRTYPSLGRNQGVLDLARTCKKPAIVFCRTRADTKVLCLQVKMESPELNVRYYHAGLSREERVHLESWFMESRDGILFATSAFGLGLDKRDVRTVIHHSLPDNIEEYLQESGRAGRDGELATAWVVVTKGDMDAEKPYSPLLHIFTSDRCRRMALLQALGQSKDECTGCDVCLGNVARTMNGDRAFRTLIRMYPFRFDSTRASFLLCGSRNMHICDLKAIFNPFFGQIKDWNPKSLIRAIDSLVDKDPAYPIRSVTFLDGPKLLYPADVLLYNLLAGILRRINDGYCWIIRKIRRRKGRGKKVRRPSVKAHGTLRSEAEGPLLHLWKNRARRKPHRPQSGQGPGGVNQP